MGVWLKERLYDLRIFAGSQEVANNLVQSASGAGETRKRLRDYLLSLHGRFGDFDRLIVVDLGGRVLATSSAGSAPVRLPRNWQVALRTQNQVVGDAYWDESSHRGKLLVAVPVRGLGGRVIGAFAAELNLAPMQGILREFAHDTSGAIHLVNSDGVLIASSRRIMAQRTKAIFSDDALGALARETGVVRTYTGIEDRRVVGALERVPQVDWAVVSEIPADAAFEQVRRFRDFALLIIIGLLVAVTASGYRFGLLVARPLERLIQGAREVAEGDLAVDLPEVGGGEVGSLTRVFNHMVSRLREGRRALDASNETLRAKNEELERLSTTDGLTGLANHRFLMQRLKEEGVRSNRNNREFAVLMADVDNFKEYNDSFGHPAGDEVLKKVAAIVRDSTRTMDCAARYGGEEFVVVMPETRVTGARQVAERIRARLAAELFQGQRITLSIGIAEFPKDADVPQGVIAAADAALYQAKRAGRDRVVEARKPVKAER
jgi:diguanylate cyclase (GGDEF)-like protein